MPVPPPALNVVDVLFVLVLRALLESGECQVDATLCNARRGQAASELRPRNEGSTCSEFSLENEVFMPIFSSEQTVGKIPQFRCGHCRFF